MFSLSEHIREHRWLRGGFEPKSDSKAQTHSTTLAGSIKGGNVSSGRERTMRALHTAVFSNVAQYLAH